MYNPERMHLDSIQDYSHNFMADNKIYLFEELNWSTVSYLIADFNYYISSKKSNLIEIFINSPGGEFTCCTAILNSMQLAIKNKINIFTYVVGEAASCASLIAVSGNKRFINRHANHFIHFGSYPSVITKSTEIAKLNKELKQFDNTCKEIYLKNTHITGEQLEKLREDEFGYLNAEQCKKYKFVDEIIG